MYQSLSFDTEWETRDLPFYARSDRGLVFVTKPSRMTGLGNTRKLFKMESFRGPQRVWFHFVHSQSNSKIGKTKNLLKLYLNSLRKGFVSLEAWIWQIMVLTIITWETSRINVRLNAQHRKAMNSNGNQVSRVFSRTQWESHKWSPTDPPSGCEMTINEIILHGHHGTGGVCDMYHKYPNLDLWGRNHWTYRSCCYCDRPSSEKTSKKWRDNIHELLH